jgi:hypothetical protein
MMSIKRQTKHDLQNLTLFIFLVAINTPLFKAKCVYPLEVSKMDISA